MIFWYWRMGSGLWRQYQGKKACLWRCCYYLVFRQNLWVLRRWRGNFTDDDGLSELLNSFKVHGKGSNKYDNVRIGVNSRLDTIQAAITDVKLTAFIERGLDDVNRVYRLYNKGLDGMVTLAKFLKAIYRLRSVYY